VFSGGSRGGDRGGGGWLGRAALGEGGGGGGGGGGYPEAIYKVMFEFKNCYKNLVSITVTLHCSCIYIPTNVTLPARVP